MAFSPGRSVADLDPDDMLAPISMDGRRLRSADSRRRILGAMLALILEGKPDPGAEAVAARAGVGLRTVFRLFSDMESICAEMLVPQRLEFVECFTQSNRAAPRGCGSSICAWRGFMKPACRCAGPA
jgi:AcrR family transcriptional regulator